MNFKEALKKLKIEHHAHRIMRANRRSKVDILEQYIIIAEMTDDPDRFAAWFEQTLNKAKRKFPDPEMVLRRIAKVMILAEMNEMEEVNYE